MATKNCRCCGKEFTPKINASQYCSKQCKRKSKVAQTEEWYKKHNYKLICAWCGETFFAKRKTKFCCTLCSLMAKGKINGIARKPGKLVNKKPVKSIEEVARLSREAGLSYGQYMVMHKEEE